MNPRIVARSAEARLRCWTERCLALPPDVRVETLRDEAVTVAATTATASTVTAIVATPVISFVSVNSVVSVVSHVLFSFHAVSWGRLSPRQRSTVLAFLHFFDFGFFSWYGGGCLGRLGLTWVSPCASCWRHAR